MKAEEPTAEAIGARLCTQDNRATADPMFLVQQRCRIYGMSSDYSIDFVWLDDEASEISGEELENIEADYANGKEHDGYDRVAYLDTWEFVQCFFTHAAAHEYIRVNAHNLNAPRVYVASGSRNHEWRAVRELLMKAAT